MSGPTPGSADGYEYSSIKDLWDENNRKNIRMISVIFLLGLVTAAVLSAIPGSDFGLTGGSGNLKIYMAGAVLSILCLLAEYFFGGSAKGIPTALIYIESAVICLVPGYLGTISNKNANAVLFCVALMAVSVMINDSPGRVAVFDIGAVLLFLAASYRVKDHVHFTADTISVAVTLMVSVLLSRYMLRRSLRDHRNRLRIEKELRIDRFVERMIQYAGDSETPDVTINNMLRYIGHEMHAARAYVFEGDEGGRYDNTYEWCDLDVASKKDELQDLPYEGLLDVWFHEFRRAKNVIISDIEDYRDVSESMYDLLKSKGVKRLVSGPLVVDGRAIGFFGVDDPPAEKLEDISHIIEFAGFVLAVIVRMRDHARRITNVSHHDQLTGLQNRYALMDRAEGDRDPTDPVAVIMCDLNGLKAANDNHGHEAGDDLIRRAGKALSEVFGQENVYRVGGDEFLVYDNSITKKDLDREMERFDETMKAHDVSIAIGVVYRETSSEPIDELMKEADALMYEAKNEYYKRTGLDRRKV